jgi:hypothetical protein
LFDRVFFRLSGSQITIFKQGKVPALLVRILITVHALLPACLHSTARSVDAALAFQLGMLPSQDNDGHFALEEADPFQIDTKPHGHGSSQLNCLSLRATTSNSTCRLLIGRSTAGDVHTLLYQTRLVDKWVTELKKKWVVFFQDTNGLVFR